MQHFLRVGQIFRCSAFNDLCHPLIRKGSNQAPEVDRERLEFGHNDTVTAHWTEKGQDGWERKRADPINLSPTDADLDQHLFEVLETRMCGGGTGHGPHDVYPDGHQVVARELEAKKRLVRFYQSGCFIGMCPPENIELVSGPEDAEPSTPGSEPASAWSTKQR